MESIRLNKYLSDAGICSRRQADRWIEEKRITVNGEIAGMGMKVAPDSEVCLDGKLIKKEELPQILTCHPAVPESLLWKNCRFPYLLHSGSGQQGHASFPVILQYFLQSYP